MSETASQAVQSTIRELVDANHILFDQGVVDGFGHVSVRHPERPERFLLSRSMAPALVTEQDVLEFDLDGNGVVPNSPAGYLERFIHGEIYRKRQDVMSVVHSHSPSVVPFSVVTGARLRPVCHMCGFLSEKGTPIFEIRDFAGPGSDLLITSGKLGAALADSLGEGPAVLMRGHGSTVVGSTLRQAVFRAVYTEIGARLQMEAMRLGPVTYLTEEETIGTTKTISTQYDRSWFLWLKAAERRSMAN
ncbi:MAG TPA: class II aldolase/adducin family protein [Bradyrhizobium sp.]|jgi:ribulose-5-phosphate 4-epimerase/fuculose-1-phosphate aldolase|uniref:class II aldolase/adducin family protein n=1 Tax=Bradyrhizobium sp. TaxID=376 RepID=UPI002BC9AEE1|nr:class II aldolase/adducin family protein [Bradyrhizobium sp.]HXB76365.1 class II aldolase/adducin family protein [Bradyrhizobium sp.]